MAALVGKAYAAGTLTRYETSLRHTLNSMEWKYGVSDLDIKAIDHDFISNYEFYPLSENKCANNSAVKFIHSMIFIYSYSYLADESVWNSSVASTISFHKKQH